MSREKIGELGSFKVYPYVIGDRLNVEVGYEVGGFDVYRTGSSDVILRNSNASDSKRYNGLDVGSIRFEPALGILGVKAHFRDQGDAALLINSSGITYLNFNNGTLSRSDVHERAAYALMSTAAFELKKIDGLPEALEGVIFNSLADDVFLEKFFEFNRLKTADEELCGFLSKLKPEDLLKMMAYEKFEELVNKGLRN